MFLPNLFQPFVIQIALITAMGWWLRSLAGSKRSCRGKLYYIISMPFCCHFQNFTLLCADAVSSQSGRVLPLAEVGAWCRSRGVVFVVDATQSLLHWFDWNLGNPKEGNGTTKGVR